MIDLHNDGNHIYVELVYIRSCLVTVGVKKKDRRMSHSEVPREWRFMVHVTPAELQELMYGSYVMYSRNCGFIIEVVCRLL